jgi:hypothetical protein
MLIRYLGIGSVALLCGAALFQIVRPSVPIIKTVWAVEGEQICRQNQQVTASGRPPLVALSHDSLGRSLPSKDGCNVLAKGEVFLVSTDVQTSFDSRYFGPVAGLRPARPGPLSRSLARPRRAFEGSPGNWRRGGARVMGVEGKIKGGGVTTRLTPCLHIGFRNSLPFGCGVASLAVFPASAGNIEGVTLFLTMSQSRNPACVV